MPPVTVRNIGPANSSPSLWIINHSWGHNDKSLSSRDICCTKLLGPYPCTTLKLSAELQTDALKCAEKEIAV